MQRRIRLAPPCRVAATAACLATAALLGACAAVGPSVSPGEIPALEARLETSPEDVNARVRLGAAYGAAGRAADARETLEAAVAMDGVPVAAWAHLGTWREEEGDLEGAAEAYRTYLETGGPAASAVESQLARIEHRMLAERARTALDREAELSGEPVDPATVGVLPMVVEGPPQYEALGVGLAELLTTDLSITDRLTVLERAQLTALLDEMKLALAGYTDPESAARVGRLTRAGRLVQGRVVIAEEDGQATVRALVVDAASPDRPGEASEEGALETLMDMEVQLALSIYRELGIELTAAERARLEDRPTRNLQAFLAYSDGLRLMDQGDFDAAAARFDAAAGIDPGFNAAAGAADRAGRMSQISAGAVGRAAGRELAVATADAAGPPAMGGGAGLDQLVDATIPAGTSATETGAGVTTGGSQTATVETTETTAGTGVGQVVTVPIVLVRPRPILVPWRLWW